MEKYWYVMFIRYLLGSFLVSLHCASQLSRVGRQGQSPDCHHAKNRFADYGEAHISDANIK